MFSSSQQRFAAYRERNETIKLSAKRLFPYPRDINNRSINFALKLETFSVNWGWGGGMSPTFLSIYASRKYASSHCFREMGRGVGGA